MVDGACIVDKKPKEMVVCNLEVLLMPNGEIICLGKIIGWFMTMKDYLSEKDIINDERN